MPSKLSQKSIEVICLEVNLPKNKSGVLAVELGHILWCFQDRNRYSLTWRTCFCYQFLRKILVSMGKYTILVVSGLESGFGSFPGGSREDFSRRIRNFGQGTWILASRGLNVRFFNL